MSACVMFSGKHRPWTKTKWTSIAFSFEVLQVILNGFVNISRVDCIKYKINTIQRR